MTPISWITWFLKSVRSPLACAEAVSAAATLSERGVSEEADTHSLRGAGAGLGTELSGNWYVDSERPKQGHRKYTV